MARNRKTERYLTWLMGKVGIDQDYSMLCDRMLHTDYIYYVGNDENRATDGMAMRYEFENRYGFLEELSDECSVLEMFVALAIRAEVVMSDPEYGNRTDVWFWEVMKNLGLDAYSNYYFDERAVNDILEDFIYRRYDRYGCKGGAFPVKKPLRDMRTTEIWYQMMWWLNENWPEED